MRLWYRTLTCVATVLFAGVSMAQEGEECELHDAACGAAGISPWLMKAEATRAAERILEGRQCL